jgi:uncharacterized protein DUF669
MPENYETVLPELFDPETQEGSHFDVVPVGYYTAQVVDACVAQPKSGDGYYIGLSWQITEGEYENRYVFQRITFQHSNAQAVTIGRRQFKDLCVATGVSEQVSDVEVFKFKPCRLKVGIEKDKQGIYEDKNRVSRVLPLEAPKNDTSKPEPKATPKAAPAATQPATASTATGNGSAPWRKPKPTLADDLDDEIPT